MVRSSPPRVLVTGGAGFLGSHLCDRLVADGYDVVCMDSELTGRSENIDQLAGNPRFRFVRHDVTQRIDLDGPLDFIMHLASPASPKDYERHSIHTMKVGAIGTYVTLGLAKAKGARFLLTSTSEVYGDPEVSPQHEGYWGHVNPVGPRSVYDEAKRFAEAITMAYHREHGLDVRIARIFNCFGPRMRLDDGRALPNFITQSIRGEPVTVYGDGSQTRSFCYVDDLIEGLLRLMQVGPVPGVNGTDYSQPVNLGNPEEVTIVQIATKIIALTGSRSDIVFRPLPVDDPRIRRPDISRAKELLGWAPQVGVEEGLSRTIESFRGRVEAGFS